MNSTERLEALGFEVGHPDEGRLLLRFPEFLDDLADGPHGKLLRELLAEPDRVACDLSATEDVDSDWWSLLAEESEDAREQGRRIGLVGVSPALIELADAVGEQDRLEYFESIDAVWQS